MLERSGTEPDIRVEQLYEDADKTVVMVALRGLNRTTINHGSTTTYEVLSGNGIMNIDGEVHELSEGVIVTVQAGTPYYDEGHLDMRATSIPPFDIVKVEFLN